MRKGCGPLVGAVLLALVAFVVWLAWAFVGGGPAAAKDLRPLPPGSQVVLEDASCPGNGNGWHGCSRAVRLTAASGGADLLDDVVAHYRAQGHRLERLPETDEFHRWAAADSPDIVFGEPGCLAADPSPRVHCFYVLPAQRLFAELGTPPVPPGAVDVEIRTYDYLR